jgi:hypothetical protein
MSYRFPNHRIHEVVSLPKILIDGQTVNHERVGEHGGRFNAVLDLVDGPYMDLRFLGKAGQLNLPQSYDASLLLDAERIRGVGYCPIARQNFRAKQRIPAGWHQNICDPNKSTEDPASNRHEPLPEFRPIDFADFTRNVAALWNIDLGWSDDLV